MDHYLEATEARGKKFFLNFNNKGKVVMLNLLRFRKIADYANFRDLEPPTKITGKQAYDLYMESTLPELDKAGSKILFYGNSENFLIGPDNEKWDAMLLVEHQSASKFIEFASNSDFLKGAGHRTASLEDSRLLPITENTL